MPIRSKLRTVLAQKDQLLEIGPGARLGKPIICGRLSVSPRQTTPLRAGVRTNLLFTMSNRTSSGPTSAANLYANDFILSTPGNGGAGRDRTDDILLAKQALSQLSYGP
jgi:hypothetical protein